MKIVFACVHNAGRSQMAAAFFTRIVDPAQAVAVSAGTRPAAGIHPEVVTAMRERGIDLGDASPRRLTDDLARSAAWLVTMGCGDECPVAPGAKRDDWPLPDPAGQGPQKVRAIRDEVRARVLAFARREGLAAPAIAEETRGSVPEVLDFLAANGLPAAGLAEHVTTLLVARMGREIAGTAALEVYGPEALLRSVAVDAALRGTGLGHELARRAIAAAKQSGARRLFLLTETAGEFFPRFGFTAIDRAAAPSSIQQTVEFASACPASARVMMLELR